MPTVSRAVPARALGLAAALAAAVASAAPSPGGEVSRAEFFAETQVYLAPFASAAEALKALIAADGYKVVAVAVFTDMDGTPLHVGRIYAEELSTLLVGPRKAYRVTDPAAIAEAVGSNGGASIWSSAKRIKEFGAQSGVELVVTGKLEISNAEARLYLKAVETDGASIVWARTVSLPGHAAGVRP